jgi:hypothetical protein
MRAALLIVGGIVQAALGAMHVAMFFAPLPESAKPIAYVLNGCVTAVALFFAYVSLFRQRELVDTAMGRVVCWSIAFFYAQTVIAGVVRSGRLLDSPFRLAVLLPMTLLYTFVATPTGSRQALLAVGGVVQVLLAALHVTVSFGSSALSPLPENLRRSFHGFNAAVAVVVLGLAYLCLFRRKDLAETSIGRAICWFAALFHLQRAAVGLAWPGFDEPGLAWVLLALGLAYGSIAATARPERSTGTTSSAVPCQSVA